jgi:voltage-gated potassium channel
MRSNVAFRKVYLSLIFLLISTVIGVVGFHVIEGYGWVDSIYMAAITMSTVGFGTLRELSPTGKMFSVILIIISAGTFVYAITTITTFVVEGEIKYFFKSYQVNQQINKLKDHIIICGLGRNGREVANELREQQVPFLIVEEDEEVLKDYLESHPGTLVLQGDATHDETLAKANIKDAQGLITALSTDAENVFITLTAREMNPHIKIVARASHESSESKLRRAGANEVIIPNLLGGKKMANVITRPAMIEFLELISGDSRFNKLHLEVFHCKDHRELIGKTLAELHIRARTGVLVLGRKPGSLPVELNPNVHTQLAEDDRLFVIGSPDQLESFHKEFLR